MREQGRIILRCKKCLQNGIVEMFEVWVMQSDAQDIKRQYEARGYEVW